MIYTNSKFKVYTFKFFSGIFHGVLERFWLQPNVALCIISGSGLGMLLSLVVSKANALKYLFLSLAVGAVAYQVHESLLL